MVLELIHRLLCADGSGIAERKTLSGSYCRLALMSRSNGSHDAKVSAAAMQGPEQLLFIVVFGDDDASIRENDLCGELLRGLPEVQRRSSRNIP
jgi:hypothetical protein